MDYDLLYIFVPIIVGICMMVLHMQYLHSTDSRRRAWSLAGLALLWAIAVLLTARYFCSFARTVEDCFRLWTLAFGICCIAAAIHGTILILARNKRDVSDLDRMKLKDL